MKIKHEKLDALALDPANARLHDSRNLAAIKASLEAFGQRKPIVVAGGVVVAGNGTLEAARALGWESIATVSADDLDEAQRTAFAIADNRTAELADWDAAKLAEALALVTEDGDELGEATGFDHETLVGLIEQERGGEVVEDEGPGEVPADPITKEGDLWLLGAYWECEDCGKKYDYAEGIEMKECPCG
jgi:ParB-like chromosome segregation protein Spo0J